MTTPSMSGRTVLVTGATNGIGLATAEALARLGAHVGVVGRDPERTEAVVARLRAAAPEGSLDGHVADLADLGQVRRLADEVTAAYPRLDVLLNNAGGIWATRRVTVDGFEHTFAVNHLAPFLLTTQLLDTLGRSAPARVVNVTSAAHADVAGFDCDVNGLFRSRNVLHDACQAKLGPAADLLMPGSASCGVSSVFAAVFF